MKIGIFGGSFNPPHKMHYQIGKECMNQGYLDRVIYVPTGNHYKYKNNLLRDQLRYEMLSLLIAGEARMEVSDFELKDHVVYTYETLEYMKKKYPNDEIYFICGIDNLSYLDTWKNGQSILENTKLLVIKRDTHNIEPILKKLRKYRNHIVVVNIPLNNISSTIIREKLKKQEDVGDYLPKKIESYIKKHHLYQGK